MPDRAPGSKSRDRGAAHATQTGDMTIRQEHQRYRLRLKAIDFTSAHTQDPREVKTMNEGRAGLDVTFVPMPVTNVHRLGKVVVYDI
jgi:hypothetical protein